MKDFLSAGLVYVPLYVIGRIVSEQGVDPFVSGWVAGVIAVLLRWAFADGAASVK